MQQNKSPPPLTQWRGAWGVAFRRFGLRGDGYLLRDGDGSRSSRSPAAFDRLGEERLQGRAQLLEVAVERLLRRVARPDQELRVLLPGKLEERELLQRLLSLECTIRRMSQELLDPGLQLAYGAVLLGAFLRQLPLRLRVRDLGDFQAAPASRRLRGCAAGRLQGH